MIYHNGLAIIFLKLLVALKRAEWWSEQKHRRHETKTRKTYLPVLFYLDFGEMDIPHSRAKS